MTNSYCESLVTLRSAPSHYLKEVGDQWRTPDLLFWGINAMFGPLMLDLFADDSNTKCPSWYTAENNALTQDWSARLEDIGGAAFGNPPYSRSQYHEKQAITGMAHIMNYAAAQREKGGRYIFLVKSATSETWWPENANHICFIRGRIGFDLPTWFKPADEKQKATSAFFAGAIAVFDKSWHGERFSYINRMEKGNLRDELAMCKEHTGNIYCHHDSVWVDEKERTLRCRRCGALVEPFNYILHLCEEENRYAENVKYLRREEKQRRQNIEKLIQIEKNAKSRIRRAGDKSPLPLWQNEKIDE